MQRSTWPVLVASAFGLVILLGLGIWQLQRLNTKIALIERIDQRFTAPPVSIAEALRQRGQGADVEYLIVEANGQYLSGPELRKIATFEGGPGFTVISPFLTTDRILVLVDRGVVPGALSDPAMRPPPADTVVKGFLRTHAAAQGLFDPDNAPESNQWFWWDIPAMLGTVGIPADAQVLDLVLHRLPDAAGERNPPIAPKPKADLRNNHLGYAITWFGLAAALVVVTSALVLRRKASNS